VRHQPNAKAIERQPDGSAEYVLPITPVALWGRDHWTTLLYIESRCVDNAGLLDNQHMRTNARVHRKLLGDAQIRAGMGGEDHPTKLRNGDQIARHDDWSCIEEMVAHGLVTVRESNTTDQPFGGGKVRVKLTEMGWRVASRIRRDRAEGTPTVRWAPPPEMEAEIAAYLVLHDEAPDA
jgi:hypothetical protein